MIRKRNPHPADGELLGSMDEGAGGRRWRRVRSHAAACAICRARLREIDQTLEDVDRIQRQALDCLLPDPAMRRTQLRAELREFSSSPDRTPDTTWASSIASRFALIQRPALSQSRAACVAAAAIVIVMGGGILHRHFHVAAAPPTGVGQQYAAVPNRVLTPGAIRNVSLNTVCSMPHEEVVRPVPIPLRQKVFKEYGIIHPAANSYEIDYLIAPGLGGAENLHNLWPEPNSDALWNARVKDALEERLHQMVCSGQIDLSTAQHEIATDWIAAYKKYFRTDVPLATSVNPAGLSREAPTIRFQKGQLLEANDL